MRAPKGTKITTIHNTSLLIIRPLSSIIRIIYTSNIARYQRRITHIYWQFKHSSQRFYTCQFNSSPYCLERYKILIQSRFSLYCLSRICDLCRSKQNPIPKRSIPIVFTYKCMRSFFSHTRIYTQRTIIRSILYNRIHIIKKKIQRYITTFCISCILIIYHFGYSDTILDTYLQRISISILCIDSHFTLFLRSKIIQNCLIIRTKSTIERFSIQIFLANKTIFHIIHGIQNILIAYYTKM